jgi:membrane-associated phospholipid phosphatase
MRHWDSLEKMALGVSVTLYVCYLIYIFYPVLGPRYYLENNYYLPLIGPVLTPLVQKVISLTALHNLGFSELHGGAMPSARCAMSLVCTWYLAKEFRIESYLLYACLILLCVSAIYLRFNYLTDVVVGLLVGGISIMLTSRWQNHFLKATGKSVSSLDHERSESVGIGV